MKDNLSEKTFVCDKSFKFANEPKHVVDVEDVKKFIKKRIYDSTMLLGLFNAGNLTTIDLREHRQRIKDEAGEGLTLLGEQK